jgi:hypothetical protein
MSNLRVGLQSIALASLIGTGCATSDDNDVDVESGKCTPDNPFACAPHATLDWANNLEPRSIDGTGNHFENPTWGAAFQPLRRSGTVAYADGVSAPARPNGPSPRAISNAVSVQGGLVPNAAGASDFLWQWGQFMDHDLDQTGDPNDGGPMERLDIAVPSGDPQFDPNGTGTATIPVTRAGFAVDSTPRQQVNKITAFIDGSNIYGSDAVRAKALRGTKGRLKTSSGNLLPFNVDGLPNASSPNNPNDPNLFLAGDVRCNEQLGLTAMHTLWMREHNRIAGLLHQQYPSMSDEDIYQTARSVVVGELQHIEFDRWIPLFLGATALPHYTGYDSTVDPRIENLFTNLYRVGHTLLSSQLAMVGNDGKPVLGGHVSLRDAFFMPDFYIQGAGIEPVLMGLSKQKAQEVDALVVEDVRSFLFGKPGQGGLDLVSLNIQRGRDHGLPSYNQARIDYGLAPATSFADITSNISVQHRLEAVYASVDDVDPWIGAVAEDHLDGAMVGELLEAVLADQFRRVRDGDRFYYETYLPQYLVEWVNKQTLAMVIRRNTTIGSKMADDAFLAPN